MAKIFDVQDWLKNHPNRNNFDLTHKVHGSYQFGKLYPVLCKPVVPTDSFRIDTAVSLRFTPMPFPTQSNMRVIFHYFYVRNKNIWKNWTNWLQGLEEHTPPYIDQSKSFYKDGSLADHLGIPTSYLAPNSNDFSPIGVAARAYSSSLDFFSLNSSLEASEFVFFNPTSVLPYFKSDGSFVGSFTFYTGTLSQNSNFYCALNLGLWKEFFLTDFFLNLPISSVISECKFSNLTFHDESVFGLDGSKPFYVLYSKKPLNKSSLALEDVVGFSQFTFDSGELSLTYCSLSDSLQRDLSPLGNIYATLLLSVYAKSAFDISNSSVFPISFSSFDVKRFVPAHHVPLENATTPYASTGDTTGKIKVSALPFRAYESIYNAFYRNSQGVQPFQINGVTQYNKYVTNDDDGADTTNYSLFERNWELDAYTSCLISPQQGNVPYVGITDISALGRMHVETPEGDSAEVRLSDNGDGVEISNLRGDTPEARAYALRAASSGFTIPEFREANALQRFLEMNIRKGYKYIDFIEGHFGKKPTYSEMDMPEFIGGFSQRISVNEISNTNGVDNDTLGAIAGQARAIGGSKHGINHYFDDFGFVVGIMCIVPDNAYDSILPKHFNLTNPLDCYFPEFSQLSYMPLTHEELAPIQTINDNRGSAYRDLTKVFGYQRPNHDLVWYPDTVHGLFRDASGIGNSVICRRFSRRPDLSDAFLRIKPDETDTIFNYTFGDEDVALGEIVLSIKAKRPIPRLVVPTIS